MAKKNLRRIVPNKGRRPSPDNRPWSLDVKCVQLLHMIRLLHMRYGENAVFHAIEVQGDKRDPVTGEPIMGWFEIRGVTDPKTGDAMKHDTPWKDPRRDVNQMAHAGLLDWIDKGKRGKSGVRLNQDGKDFLDGLAEVPAVFWFKDRVLNKWSNTYISVQDVKNIPVDPDYWENYRQELRKDWEIDEDTV